MTRPAERHIPHSQVRPRPRHVPSPPRPLQPTPDRFHTDPDLRTAFDETADGLGLRVLTADRSAGLVLIAEPT